MGEYTREDKLIQPPAQEVASFGAIQHYKRFSAGAGATQVKITESEVSIGNVASGSNYISWNGTTLTISASINANYVKTSFPDFIQGTNGRVSVDANVNTTAHIGMVSLPHGITVDRITLRSGSNITTPGTLDIAIYSEDGQTKLVEETTASLSATFSYYTITMGTPVSLPSGVYYIAIVPNSTANVSFMAGVSSFDDDTYALTSGKVIVGTLTVSAGTLPSTFTPATDISYLKNVCPALRLDNI